MVARSCRDLYFYGSRINKEEKWSEDMIQECKAIADNTLFTPPGVLDRY